MPVRSRGHLPSGNAGRAAEAFLRREKAFRGTDPMKGSPMRETGEIQLFPASGFPEGNCGKHRGIEGGEGTGQLVILDRFEDVRGIQGKKKTDRGRSVGGDGPEKEGEIKPRPRPRLPGQILDDHQVGQRRWKGRSGHRGEKPS